MDWDDRTVGRVLSRREVVTLLAVSSLGIGAWDVYAAQAGASPAACVVKPEMTEGPYFVDKQVVRSDIRSDPATGAQKPGVPLTLAFAVSQMSGAGCSPLPGATVDLWQCDALGEYSGFADPRFASSTIGATFLRGAQPTDARGTARFTTIYPGWYAGRAVHIHFKIRTPGASGQTYEFTSQLFMPEELNDQVHGQLPYAKKGRRDTMNAQDGIYRGGGDQLLLQPTKAGGGYDANFTIALDLSNASVGQPDGGGGRGGPRGGRRGRGPA